MHCMYRATTIRAIPIITAQGGAVTLTDSKHVMLEIEQERIVLLLLSNITNTINHQGKYNTESSLIKPQKNQCLLSDIAKSANQSHLHL
jgi:hypothetical protein